MGEMRIIDRTGDSVLAWTEEEAEAIREAEEKFNQLVVRGQHLAFDVVEGGGSRKIEKFDPNANRILVFPRVVGG